MTVLLRISVSSVAFLQLYPSYRYSLLLRMLFRRGSDRVEYILRRCAGVRVPEWGIGWTLTLESNETPRPRGRFVEVEERSSASTAESNETPRGRFKPGTIRS